MSDQSRSADNSILKKIWMYRTNAGVVGPIDTEQFLRAVRNGVIAPQTPVRLTDCQEWITAGEIGGLEFSTSTPATLRSAPRSSLDNALPPPASGEMRRLFAECIDRKRSHAPRPLRVREKSPAIRLTVPLGAAFGSVVSFASDAVRSFFEWVSLWLNRIFGSRVTWGAILVLLVLLVLPRLFSGIRAFSGTQKQNYLTLQETFAEVKELRSKRVDEVAWREFQERTEDKLARLVPGLERNAKSSDPVSMSLLRIARDYLPRLLNDRNGLSVEAERIIEAHLMNVRNGTQKTHRTGASWDGLATAMIGLDVLGACVAVGYIGYILLKRVLPGTKH